ncbi:MAG: helix-turn-helix transcriptional regulator [Thermorudis peleae]|nr:helix-turn-helix transcriptional regulator [Thermorudis peleae]
MTAVRSLREWRLLRGYGQRELARLAAVSHSTIVGIERGRYRGYPSTWRKVAGVLGIDVAQIAEYRRAVGLDQETEQHDAPRSG